MLPLLGSLLLGVACADSLPVRPLTQWVHTTWTARDRAPSDIRALAQTADGYLWLGTVSGLVRFDGVRFVYLSDSTTSKGIKRLRATSDGSLWVVWGSGEVTRMRQGHSEHFGPETGLPVTHELAESKSGVLIAGTAGGIYRFTDGTWTNVSQDWGYRGQQAQEVWFDREGGLWVIEGERVSYLAPTGRRFLEAGRLRTEPGTTDLAQAPDGTIWLAELRRSVHTLELAGEPHPFTEVRVGSNAMLFDRKGSLWIGTLGDGLRRVMDPARVGGRSIGQFGREAEQYTESDGLLTDIVAALLEDREGNIWVASPRGLERFRESVFLPTPIPGGTRARIIYAARDSSLWVATFNRQNFYHLRAGHQTAVSATWIPVNWAQDSSGRVWSVADARIERFNGRDFTILSSIRPRVDHLGDVAVDPAGMVWFHDRERGLLRLEHDSLIQVSAPQNPAETIGRLFIDRGGRVWVAQYHQVLLNDHGRLSRFDKRNGFQDWVQAFYEDGRGTIWAVGPQGISRFENGALRTMPARQALPGKGLFGLAVDGEGAWWVVTRTTVLRVPPGEVQRAWADTSYQMQYRSFDQRDGIPGTFPRTTSGPQIAGTLDGRIWVASDSGVATVDPRQLSAPVPPAALIEALVVDGRERPAAGEPILPPRVANLEIDYTAMTLSTPERVQFRFQLEGVDPDWQDVGTRRQAYYTGLRPGKYRFRVATTLDGRAWNRLEAVLPFRILPTWYQTIWFRALVVLAIGGLGGAAVALAQRARHHRAQKALAEKYEAALAERARIAQDLHDTLLQGFAGVTLQLKTAELALPEQPDIAAETILRVQQLARSSLREARERVWDMRETDLGGEDLAAALEAIARERAAGTAIDISLKVAGQRRRLTRAVENATFRVGREAIVNAVRHAEARRIEILAHFGTDSLRLEIADDGKGFTPEAAATARHTGHFGLSGMQDRAAHLGGRCEVRARPGGGTIVALDLPLRDRLAD
jgi:signal transduction histidine kinase/ligand-binding sensor domain-containing protein